MFYDDVEESCNFIRKQMKQEVEIALILGSGLGGLIDILEDQVIIPYKDIPHFPQVKVAGHAGNLVLGSIGDHYVMMMQGRFHYYEGFTMKELTYPIYVMKLLNVSSLIITNACGGINQSFKPGDLMLMEDFINGVSVNPLIGDNDERFGPRFPDMSKPFNPEFVEHAKKIAQKEKIEYCQGVYTFFQGPYYESAAEIRMYDKLGSDAIGMSSVPEVIAANYMGLRVLGIACITNMATGIRKDQHSHQEVVRIANASSEKLSRWIASIIKG
ncbi:MAG: purine-nucleoside phosphorylase [Erysipelotrichaceae bacterium]